jgi:hypothetical protein
LPFGAHGKEGSTFRVRQRLRPKSPANGAVVLPGLACPESCGYETGTHFGDWRASAGKRHVWFSLRYRSAPPSETDGGLTPPRLAAERLDNLVIFHASG